MKLGAARGEVLAVAILMGCLGASCDEGPSCEWMFSENSKDPMPPSWKAEGVTLAAGAVICKSTNERDLAAVERTTESVAVRAGKLRDELRAKGWAVVAGKDGPGTASTYSVTLERGNENVVLTVHPVPDPAGRPALGIQLGLVARRLHGP